MGIYNEDTTLGMVLSGDYNRRLDLGDMYSLSGVSVPYIGNIYPNPDIWFYDASESTSNNYRYSNTHGTTEIALYPEYHTCGQVQSHLNSMDTQRIPVAIHGGATMAGIWGFDEMTRRNVLRHNHNSLTGILENYISLAMRDVTPVNLDRAEKFLGRKYDEAARSDFLYLNRSSSRYNNGNITSLLWKSTSYVFLETAVIMALQDDLDQSRISMSIDVVDGIRLKCDSALSSLKRRYPHVATKFMYYGA